MATNKIKELYTDIWEGITSGYPRIQSIDAKYLENLGKQMKNLAVSRRSLKIFGISV